MSDVEYVEGLMNYDVNCVENCSCSLAVGDIVFEIDKSSFSELNESNQYSEISTATATANAIENHEIVQNHEIVNEIIESSEVVNEIVQNEIVSEVVQNEVVNDVVSEVVENSEIVEINEIVQNEIVHADNSVVNNYVVNNCVQPTAPDKNVTVNFNAYNEFKSSDNDMDSVLSAFSDRLAEAVACAAEGLHL
jgi:hypothetical protein